MKVRVNHDNRDDEMLDFIILKGRVKVKSRIITLDFRRADFCLFRELLGRIPLDMALGARGLWESWSLFKDHLL